MSAGCRILNFIGDKLRCVLQQELNHFYREKLMTTITEVHDGIVALNTKLVDVKTKLDGIRDLVSALQGGQVASQAQIDELAGLVNDASTAIDSVSTEEDAIK
jgi:uncharacterized protein involved in exopolysaccharide biosynthesis